jgi:hypothetical protein
MTDKANTEKFRKEIFGRSEANHQLHVGYFITWFARVEQSITLLIAVESKFKDLRTFEILTRGMDMRVKLERLKMICTVNERPYGPNLSSRLRHLNDKIRPLRNDLTHSAHAYNEKESRAFF